jgi:hypothetical protein
MTLQMFHPRIWAAASNCRQNINSADHMLNRKSSCIDRKTFGRPHMVAAYLVLISSIIVKIRLPSPAPTGDGCIDRYGRPTPALGIANTAAGAMLDVMGCAEDWP